MTGQPEEDDGPCTAMVTIQSDLPDRLPTRHDMADLYPGTTRPTERVSP